MNIASNNLTILKYNPTLNSYELLKNLNLRNNVSVKKLKITIIDDTIYILYVPVNKKIIVYSTKINTDDSFFIVNSEVFRQDQITGNSTNDISI